MAKHLPTYLLAYLPTHRLHAPSDTVTRGVEKSFDSRVLCYAMLCYAMYLYVMLCYVMVGTYLGVSGEYLSLE